VCCGFGVDFCVCFVDLALICLVFVGWHRFPVFFLDLVWVSMFCLVDVVWLSLLFFGLH